MNMAKKDLYFTRKKAKFFCGQNGKDHRERERELTRGLNMRMKVIRLGAKVES